MWYLILGLLGLVYFALNSIALSQGPVGTYLLQPLLWIGLALTSIVLARYDNLAIIRFKRVARWYLGRTPFQAGLLLGGFQVALLIVVGLFAGFGKSPYSFTPSSVLLNVVLVSSLLAGTEISRAYLIKRGTQQRRYTSLVITGVSLAYAMMTITATRITGLATETPVVILEFLGATVITAIAMNLLASYLSYLGGATASLGYVGVLAMFHWFSPVLPNPHWTILALIGTIAPAVGYSLLQNSIREPGPQRRRKPRRQLSSGGYGWTAVAVFGIIIVFFSFGFLGVTPTVISSGSMQPTLAVGDIAIIQKIDPGTVKPGDIIQFVQDNVTLVHRVESITTTSGQTLYTTKGDANRIIDAQPISQQQILGKSVFTIPKVGWISLFIKDVLRAIGIRT